MRTQSSLDPTKEALEIGCPSASFSQANEEFPNSGRLRDEENGSKPEQERSRDIANTGCRNVDKLLASIAKSLQQASAEVQRMREAYINREMKSYWVSVLVTADAIGHCSRLMSEVGELLKTEEL